MRVTWRSAGRQDGRCNRRWPGGNALVWMDRLGGGERTSRHAVAVSFASLVTTNAGRVCEGSDDEIGWQRREADGAGTFLDSAGRARRAGNGEHPQRCIVVGGVGERHPQRWILCRRREDWRGKGFFGRGWNSAGACLWSRRGCCGGAWRIERGVWRGDNGVEEVGKADDGVVMCGGEGRHG